MGSWGTAIFADDLAADVRGDWRDAILDGGDPAQVTRQLIGRYSAAADDQGEAGVFWLALAAAQLETGRLDDAVRDRALEVIDRNVDLARWREQHPSLARRRERALQRLAEGLRGPPPQPKRLRRSQPAAVRFEIGDVVRLRSSTAMKVFAIIVAHLDGHPRGTANPVVELVIWEGARLPPAAQLAQLQCLLTQVGSSPRLRPHLFVVSTPSRTRRFGSHIGEVVARGVPRSPAGDPRNGAVNGGEALTSWTTWDGLLRFIATERFERDVELTWRRRARSRE